MSRPVSDNSLYRKIEQDLRCTIERGQWPVGDRLPDEKSLSEQYSVSRTTIRQALAILQKQKWVDRIPGRQGLYVSRRSQVSRYLHLLVRSPSSSWMGYYTSFIIAQAEQSARRVGWRFCLHQVFDWQQAQQVADEISRDPMAIGGLLHGKFTSEEVVSLTTSSCIPWVILSDLFEPIRAEPVLNQVICDPFSSIHQASRCLLESGCTNPTLFVFDRRLLWSQEAISAYRSVFDSGGLPADKQQIFDLCALRSNQLPRMSASDNTLANVQAMHRVFAYWKKTGLWPDGIILPGHDVRVLEIALHQDDEAFHQLQNRQLILTGSDESYEIFGHQPHVCRTRWVLASVSQMTDTAVSLIQEHGHAPNLPKRKYLRDVRVAEEPAMAESIQGNGHESVSLVIV